MGDTEGGTPGAPSATAADSVKVPAILLAVMSGLGAATSLVIFFVALLGVAVGGRPPEGMEEAERVGFAFGQAFAVAFWLVGAGVGGVILLGAIQMSRLRSYGLAMTASILAIIPCVWSCFIVGIPLGIWALVVLRRPEVRAAFR